MNPIILTLPFRLPCLNEIIATAQYNRYAYGHMKKKHGNHVAEEIIIQRIPKISEPVTLDITWVEPNARRDLDGILAGCKFILDALVETGRLPDDSRKWVTSILSRFPPPDKARPRIVVKISPSTGTPQQS